MRVRILDKFYSREAGQRLRYQTADMRLFGRIEDE